MASAAALAEGRPEFDPAHRDMDVPLSDRGVLQARALSIWLEGLPELPDVIWSSPYRRALDTACLAVESSGCDIPVVTDERLCEREFGLLDRLTKVGIEARHPEQAAARTFLGQRYHRPPGGGRFAHGAARGRTDHPYLPDTHTPDGV